LRQVGHLSEAITAPVNDAEAVHDTYLVLDKGFHLGSLDKKRDGEADLDWTPNTDDNHGNPDALGTNSEEACSYNGATN